MQAAPTNTSNAILTPGSLFTSGIKSEAATSIVTPADSGRPKLTSWRKTAIVITPATVAMPSATDDPQANPRLRPLASITDETVNPSGILCRKTATKIIQPSAGETRNPDAIAIPSKNV